jgi:hypothetical protein
MDSKGPEGVWPQAPVCRLLWRPKAVLCRLETRRPVGRLPVPQVLRALHVDDLDRPLEPEGAVAAAPMVGTARLVLCLLGDDLRPRFKGVWSTAVNFAPLPLLDTRSGPYPQRHR